MTETTPIAVPTADDRQAATSASLSARNRLVISLLLVSTFVVILNETIMGVAIPHLMKDLHISASAAQWLTTAVMLTMAVVIPITGFLLQRFHTRPVFITAMTLFSFGTLIAAVAPNFEVLLVARVVQACGTAIMIPLLFTTVMTLVPEQSRGRTIGNISIVISVAPAIGPTISGIILDQLDWRWMFILVLPIAITALILGAVRVPNVTEPRVTPIDVVSVVLSALGFGGLVYGLSNLGTPGGGITQLSGWLPIAVGAVGLALFIYRQIRLQRRDRALLDLRTFRSKTFSYAIVMVMISMIALFGTIILLPFYTQRVLGLDVLSTGLLLLPGGLLMGLLAPFVGRFYDAHGTRLLVIPGAIIVSAVLWSLTFLGVNTSFWWVLVSHVAELWTRSALHAAVHRGPRGAQARALLARKRNRRHGPAGGWRGGNRAVHLRDGHRFGTAARGWCLGRGGNRLGNPRRLPLRRRHLPLGHPRGILHPQAGQRA